MILNKGTAHILALFSTLVFVANSSCEVSPAFNDNLTLGGPAVVCLHIYIPSKGNLTYAFNVTVDKFSSLKISGLAETLKGQTQAITAYLQFQNIDNVSLIEPMEIFIPQGQGTKSIYRDIFSFVVNINNGSFAKMSLDNAKCDVCNTADGGQYCKADTDQCYELANEAKYEGEDPKFFISWIGTDIKQNHMLSHTKRLSRFTQYSIGSIYQKAKSLVVQ